MGSVRRLWRGFRRDEQVALGICAVLLTFLAGIEYSRQRDAQPLPPLFQDTVGHGQTFKAGSRSVKAAVPHTLVHVAGAVRRPGVQQLPAGSRVVDAVRAAGGSARGGDINALNLAARLQDGQQVMLPQRLSPQALALAPAGARSSESSGVKRSNTDQESRQHSVFLGKINVNTATPMELEALPGVGPAIAGRIVQQRLQQGPFRSLADLDRVKALGPKKLAALKDHVTF